MSGCVEIATLLASMLLLASTFLLLASMLASTPLLLISMLASTPHLAPGGADFEPVFVGVNLSTEKISGALSKSPELLLKCWQP